MGCILWVDLFQGNQIQGQLFQGQFPVSDCYFIDLSVFLEEQNNYIFFRLFQIKFSKKQIMSQQPILTILHFNDVYDIQERNEKGGIVNFKCKLQSLKQKHHNSIVLFSGDAFSPSILSTINQGRQMQHCLNQLQIDAACYGNHQFDYSHQHLIDLKNGSNFPWLLGNIKYLPTGQNLGEGKQFVIIHKYGMKIGVFGIAGEDWPGILPATYYGKVQYQDHIEHSKKVCKILKQQYHCKFIIALTHMRNGPDCLYPTFVKDVDLVLGGHDHVILKQYIDNVPVIKSGTNFLQVGVINVYRQSVLKPDICLGRRFNFDFDVIEVEKAPQDKIDLQLRQYVDVLLQQYMKYDKLVGHTEVDLDMRFGFHRRNQSTYGNFLADLYRLYVDSEVSFSNSGNIRNDFILQKGQLWFSDVQNIIQDTLIVKQMTGKQILASLQISVDCLPLGTKGSFLQVSGIKFTYSTKRPPGSRVKQVWVNGQPLQMKNKYSVAMISYIADGGDNYTFLKDCPILKDQAETISTIDLVKTFFQNINYDLVPQEQKSRIKVKPQSQAIKRIVKLQSNVVKNQEGEYLPVICPKIEGRIEDISQFDDFGSCKFLQDKQEGTTDASVENVVHMIVDFFDL